MITPRKVTVLREVRAHARKARKAGKCLKCRRPWYDCVCTCGQWGADEEKLLKKVQPILEEKDRKDQEAEAKAQAEEVRKIDASLKPVRELEELWLPKPMRLGKKD